MQEFSLKDAALALKKWLWLIAALTLTVSLATAGYMFTRDNVYTAKSLLYVQSSYTDSQGNERIETYASTLLSKDFKKLVLMPPVLEEAARAAGMASISAGNLAVSQVGDSCVVCIAATYESPERSATVANAVADAFTAYVDGLGVAGKASITAYAVAPTAPSGPAKKRTVAMAALLTLILSVAAAIAREMLDTRIRKREDVEKHLRLPVLAEVTGYSKEMDGYFETKRGAKGTLFAAMSESTQEDAKAIVTNMLFAASDTKPLSDMVITSCAPKEGKSSLLVMLATILSETGKRVLLVDMDMRNPSLGKYIGVRNKASLYDFVTGKAAWEETVRETPIRNLWFVDSHRTESGMAVRVANSKQFDRFRDMAREAFDYVLYDTPPLGLYIEAAMLAAKTDGVLLVLAEHRVDREAARMVVNQLQKAEANILGVVLNFASHKAARYAYYRKGYGDAEPRRAAKAE